VIAGRDIIYFSALAWGGAWQRFHHFASSFAERNRVLYVEPQLSLPGLLKRRQSLRQAFRLLRPAGRSLWVLFVPAAFPRWPREGWWLRQANRALLAQGLHWARRELGFRRPIVWVNWPPAVHLASIPGRALLCYDCADEFSAMPNAPSGIAREEAQLLREADLVFVSSRQLLEAKRALRPALHLVPNAADYDHFARPAQPAPELGKMARPIIGYVGSLAPWVDYELLGFVARARPGWSLALVGPIEGDVSALRGLKNVHLLGRRPYRRLPCYVQGFDVALIPFQVDRLTRHVNPVKLYEYLAAGKPVVATRLPELEAFSHLVRVADSQAEFLEAVGEAAAERDEARIEERQKAARQHTWRARMTQISGLLEAALEREHERADLS
jgi:glycosyltransferase involved in cell wall biosynthesis